MITAPISHPAQPTAANGLPVLTGAQAFALYEAVRHRLPAAEFPDHAERLPDLAAVAEVADAFVFDAFGVLNVGEQPIPGAAERVAWLRRRGKAVRVLSNAATFDRGATVEKFRKLGFDFAAEEIVTSRQAALAGLERGRRWGVICGSGETGEGLPDGWHPLEDDARAYDMADAILFLSTQDWTAHRQNLLQASLEARPRPLVIANPDIVAPRQGGMTVEPGYFGHLLADRLGLAVTFHGKPFPSVYPLVEATLPGIAKERIVMVGDTLHTDILGARAAGWRTVLVSDHGLFASGGADVAIRRSGLCPDWQVGSI